MNTNKSRTLADGTEVTIQGEVEGASPFNSGELYADIEYTHTDEEPRTATVTLPHSYLQNKYGKVLGQNIDFGAIRAEELVRFVLDAAKETEGEFNASRRYPKGYILVRKGRLRYIPDIIDMRSVVHQGILN